MRFFQNKKSMVQGFIVTVLLLTAGFLLIFAILETFKGKAEAKTTDAICEGSVALRDITYKDLKVAGVKVTSVGSPLLCRTAEKYLPENKEATKEQVEKEISDLMAACWNRYGKGLIKDVFKQGDFVSKNCQVCYTVSLRETSNFKANKDEISSAELLKYLFENPYKVSAKGDGCKVGAESGFCIESENKDDCLTKINSDASYLSIKKNDPSCKKIGKKSCCYTEWSCWDKGGICSSSNPDIDKYNEFANIQFECPSKMKCYVKKEDYYSYGEYIQSFGGPGNILLLTNIKPEETYAVSFGSPTGECGICEAIGLGLGTLSASAAVYYGAAAFSIPIIGTAVGAGLVVSTFAIGYFAGKEGSKVGAPLVDKLTKVDTLFKRNINTIYLTTLNQINTGDQCRVVKDIRES